MGYTFKRPDPAAMERVLTRFPYSPEGAILRLAWLEGLSREEIAALTWDQVQFEGNALTLPDRTVPLAPSAEDCLRERYRLYAQRDPHVIISDRYQRPMPPESVSRLARTALDTEGQKVSLKDLRQDFVIRQLQTHDWTYAARVSGMAVSTLRGSFSQYFQDHRDAAPELPNMELFAKVMAENGVLASLAHSAATAPEALRAFDWGFSHVTHFYNACTTFHKKNGLVYSGIVEAAYLRDDVTIELIGDGRHIPRESMLLALRIKGADSIALITDAMRAAGVNCEKSVLGARTTGVPVVIRDDVAQLPDLSSYAGSIATMDRCLRTAHVQYGIPLPEVSRMLSLTPARLCGVSDRKGSLEKGKDGDVVVLSGDFQVQQVYARGDRCVFET